MHATSIKVAVNPQEKKHDLFQNVFGLARWFSYIPKGWSLKAITDLEILFCSAGVTKTQFWGREKTKKQKPERTRAPVILPYNSFLKYTANFRNIQPMFPEGCDLTILSYNKRHKPRKQQIVKSKLGNTSNLKFYLRVRIESIQQLPALYLLFLARKMCDPVQHHLLF